MRRWLYRLILPLLLAAVAFGALLGTSWERTAPEQTFREAVAALKRGDMETVSAAIESLEGQTGFGPHVHLLRAGRVLRKGDPSAALQLLSGLELQGDVRTPGLLLMTECYYRLGRLAEAEAVVRTLAPEEPDNADVHRWLAVIYYDLGANNSALAELGHVIRLAPDDYRPWYLLGQIDFDSEKYQQAAEHCRKALARTPPAPQRNDIVRILAASLIKTGRYAPALEVLSDAPAEPVLLSLESECQWGLGRPDRAAETLARAERLNPGERLVLLMKARLEMEAGRAEAALSPLKAQLKADPHDYECRYRLALACRSLGRTDDYQREIARMQESQQLRLKLTELSDLAIERPRDADVREQIADLCEQLGKTKLAAVYRQAAQACRRVEDLRPSAK